MAPVRTRIDTRPVDAPTAAAIERAEANAWIDMYGAAPRDFAEAAGVRVSEVAGTLVLEWAEPRRRYFSRTIGLGVFEPATEEAIDEILAVYENAGIDVFLLQELPHCRPSEYPEWLLARGLRPFDAQDRVVRGRAPLGPAAAMPAGERELVVEQVTESTTGEWAEFLPRVYGLDTGRWLHELPSRARWHQFVVREHGELVAARGMYIGDDGLAWLGMDGPVPGIMTPDYEPDALLCAAIVAHGLALGALGFIADIEAPSAAMDTPAYDYFSRLGFRRPYVRTHYARIDGGG